MPASPSRPAGDAGRSGREGGSWSARSIAEALTPRYGRYVPGTMPGLVCFGRFGAREAASDTASHLHFPCRGVLFRLGSPQPEREGLSLRPRIPPARSSAGSDVVVSPAGRRPVRRCPPAARWTRTPTRRPDRAGCAPSTGGTSWKGSIDRSDRIRWRLDDAPPIQPAGDSGMCLCGCVRLATASRVSLCESPL
jgi:hypothetical protein